MAKKSYTAAGRRSNASRPSQPALVRSPATSDATSKDTATKAQSTPITVPSSTPKAQKPVTAGTRSATATKSTRTPTKPTAPASGKYGKAAVRAASQMARRSTIKAENFSYALKDLRFIAIMAGLMFLTMIVLHATLPGGTFSFLK
jgi:hypothetical protein